MDGRWGRSAGLGRERERENVRGQKVRAAAGRVRHGRRATSAGRFRLQNSRWGREVAVSVLCSGLVPAKLRLVPSCNANASRPLFFSTDLFPPTSVALLVDCSKICRISVLRKINQFCSGGKQKRNSTFVRTRKLKEQMLRCTLPFLPFHVGKIFGDLFPRICHCA